MKNLKITTIALMLLAGSLSIQAQNENKVDVKVLPTAAKGFIKVLFVADNIADVQVKFYNQQGLYTVDVVKKNTYQNGFLKKYDIRNVHPGESFWIEVSMDGVVATYKMEELDKPGNYVAKLERTELIQATIVASKD